MSKSSSSRVHGRPTTALAGISCWEMWWLCAWIRRVLPDFEQNRTTAAGVSSRRGCARLVITRGLRTAKFEPPTDIVLTVPDDNPLHRPSCREHWFKAIHRLMKTLPSHHRQITSLASHHLRTQQSVFVSMHTITSFQRHSPVLRMSSQKCAVTVCPNHRWLSTHLHLRTR